MFCVLCLKFCPFSGVNPNGQLTQECQSSKLKMVPCKSTAEEVSFEWSHHRISSTDSKVRTTLHVSIIDFDTDRLKVLSVCQLPVNQHSNPLSII